MSRETQAEGGTQTDHRRKMNQLWGRRIVSWKTDRQRLVEDKSSGRETDRVEGRSSRGRRIVRAGRSSASEVGQQGGVARRCSRSASQGVAAGRRRRVRRRKGGRRKAALSSLTSL